MPPSLGNTNFAQRTGDPITFAFNNNGPVLIVTVHYYTSNYPVSVTFDGINLANIARGSYSSGTDIWKLADAPQGSKNVSVDMPGSQTVRIGVLSWLAAVDAINGDQTAAAGQTNATFTKTPLTSSIMYMSASWHNQTYDGTPGSGTVELDDSDLSSSSGRAYECYEIPVGGAQTINATHTSADQSACYCEITGGGRLAQILDHAKFPFQFRVPDLPWRRGKGGLLVPYPGILAARLAGPRPAG